MSTVPRVGSSFGGYRITGVLGRGGMGVVLSAVREDLNRQVALKILSPQLADDPEFRDRFIREAAVLSRLYSPHIIDIYDHGEQDGCLYIASPSVNAGDLGALLSERGPLAVRGALDIVGQVAAGLADAHGASIVHRDIKPRNVLLHRSGDGELFAYLCDFGIAHDDAEQATPTRGLIGTLGYVAPERHRGRQASVATDIYSLGCLLHATLTGRPPYDGTDAQVAFQHLYAAIPHYRGTDPAAPLVDAVLQRCLAKDPADRYASANEVRTEVLAARSASGPDVTSDPLTSTSPRATSAAATATAAYDVLPPAVDRPGPTEDGPRRPRSRRGWLIALVALVLVAGMSASAWSNDALACTLGLIDQEHETCQGQGADDTGADADASAGGTGTSGAPGAVRCWDGTQVAGKEECAKPVGLDGLRWMFPTFDRDFASCALRPDPTVDASLRSWRCPVSGGPPGESVTYTEWFTPVAAHSHYAPEYALPPLNFTVGGVPVGYRWWRTQPNEYGHYKESVAYLRLPFSASIYARTFEGLERICEGLTARSQQTMPPKPLECDLPAGPDQAGPPARAPVSVTVTVRGG